MLAPIVPHRNIFCVGKNYAEHAAEFAASGFDATGSPDGQHLPEYPVVFTKPAATVIATGDPIDPHTDITSALDYEGEIGVIIGKRASKVSAADALDYVWGYTLINDITARDLQRDHKQWFIGKSLDTFCPLGPWAVTADDVDITNLQLQTHVNGELRQDTNTSLLIFDVPTIIETLSAGITLEPGDVIATGTPVGVGIGFNPPKYLQPGDEVRVTATGLGELHNVIGDPDGADQLVTAGTHQLFVEKTGSGPAVVLIHGLGGATTVYEPQVAALAETHTVLRYDLSGHGRSPYAGSPSIDGWVQELADLLDAEGIEQTALVAHSMGTLVANTFAARYPDRVTKLALLGAVRAQTRAGEGRDPRRAGTVRGGGMSAVADTILGAALSKATHAERPVSGRRGPRTAPGSGPGGLRRSVRGTGRRRRTRLRGHQRTGTPRHRRRGQGQRRRHQRGTVVDLPQRAVARPRRCRALAQPRRPRRRDQPARRVPHQALTFALKRSDDNVVCTAQRSFSPVHQRTDLRLLGIRPLRRRGPGPRQPHRRRPPRHG